MLHFRIENSFQSRQRQRRNEAVVHENGKKSFVFVKKGYLKIEQEVNLYTVIHQDESNSMASKYLTHEISLLIRTLKTGSRYIESSMGSGPGSGYPPHRWWIRRS